MAGKVKEIVYKFAVGNAEVTESRLSRALGRLVSEVALSGGASSAADRRGEIDAILRDAEASVNSRVARIAAVYRRAGASLSDAFRQAWADVKAYAAEAGEALGSYLSGLDEIRRYPVTLSAPGGGNGGGGGSGGDGGSAADAAGAYAEAVAAALGDAGRDFDKYAASVTDALSAISADVAALDLTDITVEVSVIGAEAVAELAHVFAYALSASVTGAGNALSWLWHDVIVPVAGVMSGVFSSAVSGASSVLSSLWHDVIVPMAGVMLGAFSSAVSFVSSLFSGTMPDSAGDAAESLDSLRRDSAEPLADWLGGDFPGTVAVASGAIRSTMGALLSFISSSFAGGWSRAWLGIGDDVSRCFEGCSGSIRSGINSVIGFFNMLISAAVDALNALSAAVGSLSFTVPDWVPLIGGESFGFELPKLTSPEIPYLARGAVIPPNAPFAAVLGDQRSGTNIEAPLDTIKAAVRDVLRENGGGDGNRTYRFTAQINRWTLFDEVIEEAKMRQRTTGQNPFRLS